MSKYKIETNIPLPQKGENATGKGFSKFPIRDMKVGNSFFAPGYTPVSINSGLYAASTKLAKELGKPKQRHYKEEAEVDGVKGTRVWRNK
jgi:hypothetical protein